MNENLVPKPAYRCSLLTGISRRKPPRLGALACRRLLLAAALAQTPGTRAHQELNEVVVSARRPAIERIASVHRIEAEDIAVRGVRTLDEALELLPGVNVRTGGNGSPRIDVRGFRTRHVKLLLNGVPFGNTFDGQFDPTLIPAENIARVKMTTGASSTLYGDGAIGAVINVITRVAPRGQAATTYAEYGAGDRHRVYGTWSWGDARQGLFVSGTRQARSGFPLASGFEVTSLQGDGLRDNSDRERNHGYFNYYRDLTPATSLGATLTFAKGEFGVPGTTVDDAGDAFANRPRYQRADDEEVMSAQVSLAWQPGGALSNRAWAYVNRVTDNTRRYSDPVNPRLDDLNVRGTFSDDARSRVIGAHDEFSIAHTFGGELKFMFEAREERFAQDCLTRDIPVLPPPPMPEPSTIDLSQATGATLDFNYLATNNHGATNAAGNNEPIARLTMTRAGDGVDFALTSLAAGNFFVAGGSGPPVPDTYLSRLYFLPDQTVDVADWLFVPDPASAASTGGAVNFALPGLGDIVNNYAFRGRVGWQRPGGGGGLADPLFDGETALWRIEGTTLAELLSAEATSTGGRPNAFAAIELRQVDPTGFWGASEPPTGGPGGLAVYLVAPADAAVLNGPQAPTPQPPVVNVPPAGRGCGSGGDGSGGGTPTRYENVRFALRPFAQERTLKVATSAVELSLAPLGNLELVFGYAEHWLARDDDRSSWHGSYSAGASYALTATLRARASAARKIRMPSVQQLYDTLAGDPTLAPERALTYEAGFDYSGFAPFNFGLGVYRSDVRNFIDRDPVTEEFANNQRYRFQGVEVTARAALATGSGFEASYSYLDASDHSAQRARDELQYRPKHKFAAHLTQRLGDAFTASASVQYVGGEFFFSRQGVARTGTLDDYTLLNVRFSRDVIGRRVKAFLGADNLTDEFYEEAYGLPQAGRVVYGGIEIELL